MAVLMAITASDPIAIGIDVELASISRSLCSETGGLAGLLSSKKETGDAPPVFLNYLIFDREMNFKYVGFPPRRTGVQMSQAAREDDTNVPYEKLSQ